MNTSVSELMLIDQYARKAGRIWRCLPARMRPVLADARRSEPEIAATLNVRLARFAGAAAVVEPSISVQGWNS
jgi:hypothetical protein